MKTKLLFNVALVATFIMSAASCSNELTNEQIPENRQPMSITASLPTSADTRLNYDDSDISKLALTWKKDDVLSVYKNGFDRPPHDFELDESTADTKNGTFTGPTPVFDPNNTMLAIYPKGTYTGAFSGLQLPIANQSGVLADSPHHYMFASTIYKDNETPNFAFSHLMAIVKLQLDFSNVTATGNIKNVSLSGTGIFDKAVLAVNGTLTAATDANTTVSTASTAEFSLTDNKATVYLFVFPGTFSSVKVTATDADSNNYEADVTGATTQAGWVYKLNTEMRTVIATSYQVGDYYPAGATKDNAVGVVFYTTNNGTYGCVVSMDETEVDTWDEGQTWATNKQDGGFTWRYPTKDELQYLWCAYNGASPVTWTGKTAPCPAANTEKQAEFNTKLTTVLGVGSNNFYWTSTEDNNNASAWTVRFSNGLTTSSSKGSKPTCVRAITIFGSATSITHL